MKTSGVCVQETSLKSLLDGLDKLIDIGGIYRGETEEENHETLPSIGGNGL